MCNLADNNAVYDNEVWERIWSKQNYPCCFSGRDGHLGVCQKQILTSIKGIKISSKIFVY